MVRCGLTPMEAIECAAKNGAAYLGMEDSLGQIREQYIADLIVVGGDPSSDIAAFRDVRAVYQGGRDILKLL